MKSEWRQSDISKEWITQTTEMRVSQFSLKIRKTGLAVQLIDYRRNSNGLL